MCKTIKQQIKFQAPPLVVYRLLTNPKDQAAFTGKPSALAKKVGGRFSNYGGRFSGIVVDLDVGKRVVQAWQSKDFPAGIFSMATFNLAETSDGGTKVTLTHRGVPKELIPETETLWRTLFWEKMKRYLRTRHHGELK